MRGMTRGSLPSEVYWRRRLIVIGLALILVVGLARLLSGGGDEAGAPAGTAARSGARASMTPSASAGGAADSPGPGAAEPTTAQQARQQRRADRAAKKAAATAAADAATAAAAAAAAAALSEPQGPCADADVIVTPSLPAPVAGGDVAINLDLRTRFSPACSWSISPEQVALKITSGSEDIWSTQECPAAVPTQDLVLRRAVNATVQVVWHGRRSDETCSPRTTWALPGFYHVLAAALAGEPSDVQFELTRPLPEQITKTVQPKPTNTKKKNKQNAQ